MEDDEARVEEGVPPGREGTGGGGKEGRDVGSGGRGG